MQTISKFLVFSLMFHIVLIFGVKPTFSSVMHFNWPKRYRLRYTTTFVQLCERRPLPVTDFQRCQKGKCFKSDGIVLGAKAFPSRSPKFVADVHRNRSNVKSKCPYRKSQGSIYTFNYAARFDCQYNKRMTSEQMKLLMRSQKMNAIAKNDKNFGL